MWCGPSRHRGFGHEEEEEVPLFTVQAPFTKRTPAHVQGVPDQMDEREKGRKDVPASGQKDRAPSREPLSVDRDPGRVSPVPSRPDGPGSDPADLQPQANDPVAGKDLVVDVRLTQKDVDEVVEKVLADDAVYVCAVEINHVIRLDVSRGTPPDPVICPWRCGWMNRKK